MLKPSSSVPKNSPGTPSKDSKELVPLQWSLFVWAFNQWRGGGLYKTRLGFSNRCQTPSWSETAIPRDSEKVATYKLRREV